MMSRWMSRLLGVSVAGTLMATLAATMAFAQAYKAEEIKVTGVIEKKDTDLPLGPETGLYFINDEETGAERDLLVCSPGEVSIENFVGERVTVSGIPQTQGNPPSSFPNPNEIPMCVSAIEPAGNSGDSPNGGPSQEQPQCFLPEGCFLSDDSSSEKIVGGIGPDYIIGGYGNDALYGLGDGDWLDGGAGDDLVRGNVGDDLVDGGSGDDLVIGDDGNDYVTGYLGSDALNGGGGSDYIYAADGEFDRVSGGPGYDVCVVDEEDDASGCEKVRVQ